MIKIVQSIKNYIIVELIKIVQLIKNLIVQFKWVNYLVYELYLKKDFKEKKKKETQILSILSFRSLQPPQVSSLWALCNPHITTIDQVNANGKTHGGRPWGLAHVTSLNLSRPVLMGNTCHTTLTQLSIS